MSRHLGLMPCVRTQCTRVGSTGGSLPGGSLPAATAASGGTKEFGPLQVTPCMPIARLSAAWSCRWFPRLDPAGQMHALSEAHATQSRITFSPT